MDTFKQKIPNVQSLQILALFGMSFERGFTDILLRAMAICGLSISYLCCIYAAFMHENTTLIIK